MRNAKIVCTLGPASESRQAISDLAAAGMSVARLNASHGTPEERRKRIEHVRAVDAEIDDPLAVMLDTKGPEIRTAPLPDGETILLETNSTVRFVKGENASPDEVGLSMAIEGVAAGDQILLDDGRIEATVTDVDGQLVTAQIDNGGKLAGRKGVNIPGVDLDMDVVTEKDRRDLEFAAQEGVDFVAASFVRDAEDIYEINSVLEDAGADIPIISKIERAGAVENLGEIIDASYGIMVARGDLGVECPMEQVPVIQKRIINRCRATGTPVITATEMLDSMIHSRRPTRAEASDVANAVLDGTDAVMLSGETAIGNHPARVVKAMDRIVSEVEASAEYDEIQEQRVPGSTDARTDALARSARYLARDIHADAIVTATESGYTALKVAKYRPAVPVVAATPSHDIRRRLALSWGVIPRYAEVSDQGADAVVEKAVSAALDSGAAKSGDTVVALCGMMTELEGASTTNMLKVHVAADALATGRVVVEGRASGPIVRVPDGDLSAVESGAIVTLDEHFDAEFTGDISKLTGIIDARRGMTGYPALVARELDIPMIGGADLSEVSEGTTVTIDAERGVVYNGDIGNQSDHS